MQTLAEKVLLSMFAQGQKAAAARGCISALKAVATSGWIPPLQWDRLWRISKAAMDSPGQRQFGGPDLLQLMAESCSRVGEWKIYAATVLSFATLCGVGEISSLRRSNISKVGITYQGIKRDHHQITRPLGPYAQAWATWLRRIAPGEAPALGRAADVEMAMAKLLQGTDRGEAKWHAWRRAGATYLRWLGLPWRHLLWWGRWHRIKIAHLYASSPDEFECVQTTRLPWPATEGIRWRRTDIRDLWPASLVELFENDEKVPHPRQRPRRHDPREETAGPKRTAPQQYGRSAQGARGEEAANPDARSRKESPEQGPHQKLSLPGARGPWTRCRHRVGLTAGRHKPRLLPRRVPSMSMRNKTWRWVPRDSVTPVEERKPPDNLEGVDGSKDDPGVSRHGGRGPEPQRVSEPSTWRHWPDVQPAGPVNDECPRERAVERLIRSERGQGWLDEISTGLRLSGGLRDLLHRRIRFLFIQGGRVARDLGMVDVDDQLIAALDSLRGDVWSCVLRDSTSPVTLLLSLDPSVLDRGLGPVGNIPIPEFLWDFLAPLDFQEVTGCDLGEMPEISPEGLIMARALVRDGVLRQCAEGGGVTRGPMATRSPSPKLP